MNAILGMCLVVYLGSIWAECFYVPQSSINSTLSTCECMSLIGCFGDPREDILSPNPWCNHLNSVTLLSKLVLLVKTPEFPLQCSEFFLNFQLQISEHSHTLRSPTLRHLQLQELWTITRKTTWTTTDSLSPSCLDLRTVSSAASPSAGQFVKLQHHFAWWPTKPLLDEVYCDV